LKRPGLISGAIFAAAMLFPVAAGLFRVWVNQDAVHVGYALSEQTKRRDDLRALIRELEVELAAERSPERLMRLANKLGLKPPTSDKTFGAASRKGGEP